MDPRELPEAPFFNDTDAAIYGPKSPTLFAGPQVPVDPATWLREAVASGGVIDRGEAYREDGHMCRYAYAPA